MCVLELTLTAWNSKHSGEIKSKCVIKFPKNLKKANSGSNFHNKNSRKSFFFNTQNFVLPWWYGHGLWTGYFRLNYQRPFRYSRPVNLHPLFLKIGHPAFWKLGTLLFEKKNRGKRSKVIVIQKEKRQPGLFSFWIKNDPIFFSLLFAKSRVPHFSKIRVPDF